MSGIRPVARDDLPAVAQLYEAAMRSGSRAAPSWLPSYFERTVLDHPWADPEIPSLVYEDGNAGIVGFIACHVRRLTLDGRPLRMVCCGHLVADPAFRRHIAGAALLRRAHGGPQDLTITDGATEDVRLIWTRLGGKTSTLSSVGWTRVFRPWRLWATLPRRRRRRLPTAGRITPALDALARRTGRALLQPPAPDTVAEPLGPRHVLDGLDALDGSYRLRPAYDERFLKWLFRELRAVHARGDLHARLVREPGGRRLGWFVAYLVPDGIGQVIQVGAAPDDVAAVLDHLFREAEQAGAAALQGRVEPHTYPALSTRRCLFRRTEWALVRSDRTDVLAALGFGDALVTRMEGEWWMGHHLDGDATPVVTSAPRG
jgi:hypothetical protein